VATLRDEIEQAVRAFVTAHRAGEPDEAHRYRARLKDLLEVAERTGVDAEAWVDPFILLMTVREELTRAHSAPRAQSRLRWEDLMTSIREPR